MSADENFHKFNDLLVSYVICSKNIINRPPPPPPLSIKLSLIVLGIVTVLAIC